MTTVQLALPFLQALALGHFIKRVDFETVVGFASVAAASDDHESEADLVWLALTALRSALAEAVPGPGNGRDAGKCPPEAEPVDRNGGDRSVHLEADPGIGEIAHL